MPADRKAESPGQTIAQAISILQTAFVEASLMFKDLDEFMKEHGWQAAYGNRTTKEVTTNLNSPREWLLQGSFRIYENDEYRKKPWETRLGVTIQWWNDEHPGQEPLLLIARVDAEPGEFDHWDVWVAWREAASQTADGQAITGAKDDWAFVVSARTLTSVTDKEKLKALSAELTRYLEVDVRR